MKHKRKKQISDEIIGKNGIYFDNDIELKCDREHNSKIFFLLQIIIAFGATFFTALIFESFVNNHVTSLMLGFYSLVSVLIFSLLKAPKLKARIAGLVSLGILLVYQIINILRIKLGCFAVADNYLLAINSDYMIAGDLSGITAENRVQLSSCFYFAAIMLLAFLVTATVIYRTNFPLMFIVTFSVVELVLYWTFKVPVFVFIGLVICWIAVLAMQFTNHNAKHGYKSNTFSVNRRHNTFSLTSLSERSGFNGIFISFVCILTAGVLCASIIISSVTHLFTSPKSFKAYKEKIAKAVDSISVENLLSQFENGLDIFDGKNIGGTNSGKLGTYSKISFSGDTMLEVTTEPFENTLYLRGYVAGDYKDNSWQVTNASQYKFVDKFKKKNMLVQDLNYNMISDYYGTDDESYKKQMTINVKGANDNYLYAPYATDYSHIDVSGFFEPEPTYESYVKLGSSKYTLNYYDTLSLFDRYDDEYDDESASEDFLEEYLEEYEDYVYNVYTRDYPDEMPELDSAFDNIYSNIVFLGRDLGNDDAIYIDNICAEIRKYFEDHFTYTLSPGETPEGEDFVEYFLGTQKKGYCTYFASAGVLLLRRFGIPARYVEGYKVEPPKNQPADSQFTFDVEDYSAHAWAEIYVKGIGWTPVEFTPASENNSDNTAASYDSESDSSLLSDSTAGESSNVDNISSSSVIDSSVSDYGSHDVNSNSENSGSSEILGIINLAVEILLLIGVVLIIFIINRAIKLKRKNKLCSQYNTNERVKSIFRYTLKYFSLLNITVTKNLSDTQICEEIIRQCESKLILINKKELRTLCQIAVKAHMSYCKISEKEALQAKKIMDSTAKDIIKPKLSKIKKLSAMFVYGLY